MPADRDDEQGVLGNLPRSRPGQRSAKRSGTTARARKVPAAKPATSGRTTRAAAKKPAGAARPRPQQRPAPAAPRGSGGDPLGQAVELAGKVAAAGLRTAAGIVKRIPRP